MDTLAQTDDRTLAKARRQEAAQQVKTSIQQLEKGVTRFVRHNSTVISIVAVGGASLLAASRLVMRRSARTHRFPHLNAGWTRVKQPVRRARSAMSPATVVGALLGAGALIGTGLTMLFAPRLFTRWTQR